MNTQMRLSEKHRVLVLPYDERAASIIPSSREFMKNGHRLMLIPHRTQESKVLTNLGYAPPAPILSQYDWGHTIPFASQKTTAAMLTMSKRAFVLNGMGTGKTYATLCAADYLMKVGEVKKALIVAPLSTLSVVWDAEVFARISHRKVAVLHGTKARRIQRLKEDVDFYVINHDGVGTIEKELAKRSDIDLIIIDELATFRNANTDRWKLVNKLFKEKKWMWGLTGAPTPNAPTDAFGQIKLLAPGRVHYYKAFQNETMTQITQFKWIAKRDANDRVFEYMQPAVRFTRDQCFDLPECMYTTREVPMDKRQKKAYGEIMSHLAMRWAEGEVTAANEGVKMSKLLQIGSGYVYTTSKGVIDVGADKRLAELRSLIDQAEGKVIVFMAFKHTVDQVVKHLNMHNYSVAKIYGDTPASQRNNIFNAFQNSGNPRVLVAHPQAMSHGITLTEANTIIWYTPITSTETYMQANARITRPGQKRSQFIVHIEQNPIEKRVFKRLQNNERMQGVLLDLFEKAT